MTTPVPLGATGEKVDVQRIYPDVVRAYSALRKSVQAAIDTPPPSVDAGAGDAISTYTAVYTDGRGLVNAIERALRDPITPLREAAKDWLNGKIAEVKGKLDEEVRNFQNTVDTFTESLRVRLRHYIVDNILKPLRAALFVMPRPASPDKLPSSTPWAGLTEVLGASIDKALDEDKVWPTDGNTFFNANEFARQVAAGVRGDTTGKIDANLAKLQANALDGIAKAGTAASDLLLPPARDLLTESQIGEFTQGLTGLKITDSEKLELLFKLGGPVADAIQRLRSFADIGATLQNRCGDAVDALAKLITAALPSSDALPDGTVFDRLSKGLPVLSMKANQISFDASDIIPATKENLTRLRTKLQETIDQTQELCKAIFTGLADLALMIADFEEEKANFVAANICPLDLAKPLPWQLQRLLNYARRLSAQAARCVSDTEKLMSALGVILQGDQTNVLFLRLNYQFPSNPESTDFQDPAAGAWPNDNPTTDNEAAYLFDLLRLRLFYLVIGALEESATTVQVLSLAGVVVDPPKRGAAFDALITSAKAVLAGTSFEYVADGAQTIYSSSDPAKDTVSNRVKKKVDDFNNSAKNVIDILKKNNSPIGAEFGAKAVAFVKANDDLRDATVEVIGKVVGSATSDVLKTLPANPLTENIQAVLVAFLDRIAGQFEAIARKTLDAIAPIVQQNLTKALTPIYAASLENRNKLYVQVVDMGSNIGPVATQVANALLAPKDSNRDTTNDALAKQKETLDKIASDLGDANKRLDALIDLFNFIQSWGEHEYKNPQNPVNGPNAVLYIANQAKDVVGGLVRDVLKGDLGKIIDFAAIKSDIERRLRDLIPSKVTLTYDFDTELQNVGDIFLPEDGSRLTLKARTVIDVLNGGSPKISSSGEMGPFSVKILGGFLDIVTLSFDGAKFGSETGGKLKANVVDVQLGEAVSFLQAVSSFFSFGANGFYLSALFDPPGIEAGYRMPPCGFALGVLGVSNISLNAAAILPFDGSPALFKVGLSRPEAPFLINVAVYGGGGHLALYSTSQGIIGFESSFEFGAVVAFAIGPLTGTARITVGIFLRSFKDTVSGRNISTIEGYTTIAGSASISIFRFSAMLQVRVGQQPNGDMVGTAIFTFSFSMGIKDIEFRVTARKNMGKGYSSNPQINGDAADPSRKLVQLASNLPSGNVGSDVPGGPHTLHLAAAHDQCGAEEAKKLCDQPVAYLNYHAVCKGENYAKYQSYFDQHQPWQPAFF